MAAECITHNMENKSNKLPDNRDNLQPENLADLNPVDKSFYNSDDPKYPSDSTTGSGYSEAERNEHDATNGESPEDPNNNIKGDS